MGFEIWCCHCEVLCDDQQGALNSHRSVASSSPEQVHTPCGTLCSILRAAPCLEEALYITRWAQMQSHWLRHLMTQRARCTWWVPLHWQNGMGLWQKVLQRTSFARAPPRTASQDAVSRGRNICHTTPCVRLTLRSRSIVGGSSIVNSPSMPSKSRAARQGSKGSSALPA